jgi:hypothetical protein
MFPPTNCYWYIFLPPDENFFFVLYTRLANWFKLKHHIIQLSVLASCPTVLQLWEIKYALLFSCSRLCIWIYLPYWTEYKMTLHVRQPCLQSRKYLQTICTIVQSYGWPSTLQIINQDRKLPSGVLVNTVCSSFALFTFFGTIISLHYTNCQTFLTLYHNINNNTHEKVCCSVHKPKLKKSRMHFLMEEQPVVYCESSDEFTLWMWPLQKLTEHLCFK